MVVISYCLPGFSSENRIYERQRMSDRLRNHGYYFFQPDYIEFLVDTTQGGKMADVRIGLKQGIPHIRAHDTIHRRIPSPQLYITVMKRLRQIDPIADAGFFRIPFMRNNFVAGSRLIKTEVFHGIIHHFQP